MIWFRVRVSSDSLSGVQLFYGPVIDPFMSPEEVANAEALHRIREAENTGATSLDLSDLEFLCQLPRELEHLSSRAQVRTSARAQIK